MSEKSDPPRRKPKPLQRLSVGTLVAFQIALGLVALVAVNFLSGRYFEQRDLSRGSQFTLSELTTNLLESEPLRDRERPVRMIVALRKSSPHFSRIRATTQAYAAGAGDRLSLEFVDPVRDGERAFEIAEAYGHIFVDDVVLIDARPAQQADAVESDLPATASAHVKIIPVEEMLVFRTDGPNQRTLLGYQDEDVLSSMLRSALEGTARRFYFLADKSQLQDASENTPWATLSNTLRRQNIALTPLRLSDLERIPDDAEGIALVAPQYDLEPHEMEMLNDYWARPRAALLVVLDPVHRPRPCPGLPPGKRRSRCETTASSPSAGEARARTSSPPSPSAPSSTTSIPTWKGRRPCSKEAPAVLRFGKALRTSSTVALPLSPSSRLRRWLLGRDAIQMRRTPDFNPRVDFGQSRPRPG